MVRAKKMLMNIKMHCSTALQPFSLFHIDMSINVHELLREKVIPHGIVNLE